jgi:hypothetical protein
MAVLGLGCFRAGWAGTGEMLTSHATLGAAVEDAFPGLTGMQLAKAGDRRGDRCDAGTHSPACSRRCRRARHPAGRGRILGRPRHRNQVRSCGQAM